MAKSLNVVDFKSTAWKSCNYCSNSFFKTPNLFLLHLREKHCTIEGGSYVCHYGYNGVCSSLPLDGVSDKDYVAHVEKYHVSQSMKEAEEKWNIFSAAQNLSAVLNDPSRGRQSNLFTKKWGEKFIERNQFSPSPHLPQVDWTHFHFYCRKIGKRYRRHMRFGQIGNVDSDNVAPTPGSISPSSSISSLQIAAHNDAQNYKQFNEKLLNNATVRDIPQIFVKQDLDISKQETFSLVFEDIDITSKDHHQIQQYKLQNYLDIAEIQIAKQVSQKSSSFFHAMTSQDAIMEEMAKAVNNVRRIREKLRLIDEMVVRQSLNIISCERIKTNKLIVLEKLKLMATVHQTQPMIQVLLGTQDFVAAIDLINTTQEILSQELNGIYCFRHLPHQLKELERLIDKMLSTDFEKYSTSDLNRPLLEIDDRVLDEDKIVCIVSGLLRKKNFSFIESYKNEAITTIRAVIKQHVIEMIASSDDETCRTVTGVGEDAQSFTLSDWIILLEAATGSLTRLLKRIRLIHDLMLHVADVSVGKLHSDKESSPFISDVEVFLSSEDHVYIENKLKDLLLSVCNYCHERCANLVSNHRLEQYSGTFDEMERLTHVIEEFCLACEKIVGVKPSPLMIALKNQGTRFCQKFHSDRKSKLSSLLDNERWKSTEVSGEFQEIVDDISKGNFSFNRSRKSEFSSSTSVLMIDQKDPFTLVSVCHQLVIIISEYASCAEHLPILAAQMERNVIDLMRTFNSRSCQLVLGAGAVHIAGLKMITISNLALVSRALQLVLWLIANVKSHFKKLETNSTTWQTVEKDIASHVKELENKMVTIVTSLVNNQLDSWEARPPIPSQSFRNISRNFVKLHEAIAQVLPIEQIHCLFRIVHKNFKDKLKEQLIKNNIINNGTPQHSTVISEMTFYLETLRTLKALPPEELEDDAVIDDIWIK